MKKMQSYCGFTHLVPMWLLPLWRKLFCRVGWHAWDEVASLESHYLYCDACGTEIFIAKVVKP